MTGSGHGAALALSAAEEAVSDGSALRLSGDLIATFQQRCAFLHSKLARLASEAVVKQVLRRERIRDLQAQMGSRGRNLADIHQFSRAMVNVDTEVEEEVGDVLVGAVASSPRRESYAQRQRPPESLSQQISRKNLNAAVLDAMARRTRDAGAALVLSEEEALTTIQEVLVRDYPDPSSATRSYARRVLSDVAAQSSSEELHDLQLTVNYLSHFHKEHLSSWLNGFLGEAAVVQSCCARREGAVRDGPPKHQRPPLLNRIFAQVEGLRLAENFLKTNFAIFGGDTSNEQLRRKKQCSICSNCTNQTNVQVFGQLWKSSSS